MIARLINSNATLDDNTHVGAAGSIVCNARREFLVA
jgi:hypothetical protein